MCGSLSRLSELLEHGAAGQADLHSPPRGCSLSSDGVRTLIRASIRSGSAIFLGFFTIFWNSIVAIFLFIAGASVLKHAFGYDPAWMPPIRMEGAPEGETGIPLNETIFLCIFLIPFVLIGIGTAAAFILAIAGRVEVKINRNQGSVFTGVGPLGWRRHFDVLAVREVTTRMSSFYVNHHRLPQIVIEADRPIRFGSFMSATRRAWMLAAVRANLLPKAQRPR